MTELEGLYRAYFADVYLYLRQLTGNEHLAEELTSDTFFRAMQALPGFDGRDARAWLYTIARNLYYSTLRKNRRLTPLANDDGTAVADPPDPAPGPAAAVESASEAVRLHRRIHTLPEPYREVFLLRALGELSFAQIGAVFEKSGNWACVTYHRARRKLLQMEAEYNEK